MSLWSWGALISGRQITPACSGPSVPEDSAGGRPSVGDGAERGAHDQPGSPVLAVVLLCDRG